MRMPTGSQWSFVVIIVLMLTVIGMTLSLEFFASKLLPRFVAVSVLVLAIIALIVDVRSDAAHDPYGRAGRGKADANSVAEDRVIFVMAAWIGGLALAIYLLGFMIASFLFVSAYMKWHGAVWYTSIIGSILFAAVIYLIFNVALQVDLYRGLLFL